MCWKLLPVVIFMVPHFAVSSDLLSEDDIIKKTIANYNAENKSSDAAKVKQISSKKVEIISLSNRAVFEFKDLAAGEFKINNRAFKFSEGQSDSSVEGQIVRLLPLDSASVTNLFISSAWAADGWQEKISKAGSYLIKHSTSFLFCGHIEIRTQICRDLTTKNGVRFDLPREEFDWVSGQRVVRRYSSLEAMAKHMNALAASRSRCMNVDTKKDELKTCTAVDRYLGSLKKPTHPASRKNSTQ